MPSGRCRTWCWLIPSPRPRSRRTSGKSTGKFIAALRDAGRTWRGGGVGRGGWIVEGNRGREGGRRKRIWEEDWEKMGMEGCAEDDKALWGTGEVQINRRRKGRKGGKKGNVWKKKGGLGWGDPSCKLASYWLTPPDKKSRSLAIILSKLGGAH